MDYLIQKNLLLDSVKSKKALNLIYRLKVMIIFLAIFNLADSLANLKIQEKAKDFHQINLQIVLKNQCAHQITIK